MSHVVAIELEMPDELAGFRLPPGVDARLQALLDLQDRGQRLSAAERAEAEGLVKLAEWLSLLRCARNGLTGLGRIGDEFCPRARTAPSHATCGRPLRILWPRPSWSGSYFSHRPHRPYQCRRRDEAGQPCARLRFLFAPQTSASVGQGSANRTSGRSLSSAPSTLDGSFSLGRCARGRPDDYGTRHHFRVALEPCALYSQSAPKKPFGDGIRQDDSGKAG